MNRLKILFFLILSMGTLYLIPQRRELPFIPFDTSMEKGNAGFTQCYRAKKHTSDQWKLLKKLYEKHLSAEPSSKPRIPKIIHQIWLGGNLPEKYLPLQKSWQESHPDWEYRLWTDADLKDFPFSNRERFDRALNVGEKSDILRYEILNHFGGLYVDTDFECIQPFDVLHSLCDFYVGVEAAFVEDSEVAIGNALIGSVPAHPILAYCLERIAQQPPGRNGDQIQEISGPGCLKRAYFKCCRKGHFRNVAFPFTFFYPLPSKERDGQLGKWVKNQWIQPESFGVHYWDTSWGEKF